MTEYMRVEITEAHEGDEILQADEWARIGRVTFPTDGMVTVWWQGGGSHTFPIAHRPAVRREVTEPMSTTLTNGTHVEITREAGKGADVLAIRSLTRNPITGEVTPAALVAAPYVQHVTASLLSVLGVRDDDMPAVLALTSN